MSSTKPEPCRAIECAANDHLKWCTEETRQDVIERLWDASRAIMWAFGQEIELDNPSPHDDPATEEQQKELRILRSVIDDILALIVPIGSMRMRLEK